MALNRFKCNHLTPLHFNGLTTAAGVGCSSIRDYDYDYDQLMQRLREWVLRQRW